MGYLYEKIICFLLVVFLLLPLSGCSSLANGNNTNYNSNSNAKHILVVYLETDAKAEVSDQTQARNALQCGGQIFILNTSEGYTKTFTDSWKTFGALNADGYYYIYGAMLNFIASYGWELVHVSATEQELYFCK